MERKTTLEKAKEKTHIHSSNEVSPSVHCSKFARVIPLTPSFQSYNTSLSNKKVTKITG